MPPNKPFKNVKKSTVLDDNQSMHFTQSIPMPVYRALARYARDKGFDSEQAVLRSFAVQCLGMAGYYSVK